MMIYIDRIRRTAVRADTEGRHDRQAFKLAVILVVITPAASMTIKLSSPCLRDIRAVLGRDRC